jgi:excisionase family DNA binding protein
MKKAATSIFLTTAQAAKLLNVSVSTLKKFIYLGKIKTLRTPGGHHRILRKDLFDMRTLHLLLLALLVTLVPATARADVKFTPHVALQEEYDSNITYSHDNVISDSITRLEAGLAMDYTGKMDTMRLTGDIFHRYYRQNQEFDNTSETLQLEETHEFSKFDKLSISERYDHGTDPTSFDNQFGRTTGRYSHTSNAIDLVYRHEFTSRLTGILRGGDAFTHYSRNDISDFTTLSAGLGAEYAFGAKTIGLADYKYAKTEYSPGGSVSSNIFTGGVRHYFTSEINLEAVAGYQFLKTITNESSKNPVVVITLTDDVTNKLQAKVSYAWEDFSSEYSTDILKSSRLSAGIVDQVNRRFKVDFSGFIGTGQYQLTDERDTLKGVNFGALYELYPHVALTGSINYSVQSSNVTSASYDRTYISGGLRVEF